MRFAKEVKEDTRLAELRFIQYGRNWLRLPIEVLHGLARNGAQTVGDLHALSDDELRTIPGVGESRLEALTLAAQQAGVERLAKGKDGGILVRITGPGAVALRHFATELGVSPSDLASRAFGSSEAAADAVREVVKAQLKEQEAEIRRRLAELQGE